MLNFNLDVLTNDARCKTPGVVLGVWVVEVLTVENAKFPVMNSTRNCLAFDDSVSQRGPSVGATIIQRKEFVFDSKDPDRLIVNDKHFSGSFRNVIRLTDGLKLGHTASDQCEAVEATVIAGIIAATRIAACTA